MNATFVPVRFFRMSVGVLSLLGSSGQLAAAEPPDPSTPTAAPAVTGSVSPTGPTRAVRRDGDGFERRGDGYQTPPMSRPWVLPIFFPPAPPTLGTSVPLANPLELPNQRAPAGLAPYIGEPFYAPLGTRLAEGQLKASIKAAIEQHLAEKTALQEELRQRLGALQNADRETRKQELAALARAQAPRIAALEKSAEAIRVDLIRGNFFLTNIDWNVTRDWRIGISRFHDAEDAVTAQYQVIRAATFYQKGLLPEQRGLLREIAMELREVGATRGSNTFEAGSNPPLFFSPATSRLRLPVGLPAQVLEKISRYEREKSAIKQELKETILASDRAFFAIGRTKAVETLAQRQWPQITALEDLAEEIREELARLPNPPGPPPAPAIPDSLASRISALIERRVALRQEILAKINEIRKKFSIQRILPGKSSSGGGDLRLVLNPGSQNEEKMNALRATLAEFNQEISARQKSFREEEAAICRDLARALPDAPTQSIESVLTEYAEIIAQREDWLLYDDYQDAMLTPGLSPGQRRLLFDAALQKLVLPLPGWDLTRIRLVP